MKQENCSRLKSPDVVCLAGIDEDFKAWRKIFWRKAGPILTGRKQLTSATAGKKEKGKCGGKCKCKEDGGKCSSDEEQDSGDEVSAKIRFLR